MSQIDEQTRNFSNMRGGENIADIVKTVCKTGIKNNMRKESRFSSVAHSNTTHPSIPSLPDEVPKKPTIERNIIKTEKEFYE